MIRKRGILHDNTIGKIFNNVDPNDILSIKAVYPGISSVPGIGINGSSIANTLIGTWLVPRDLSVYKFELRCATNVTVASNIDITVTNTYVTNTLLKTITINAASNSSITTYANTNDFELYANDTISIYTKTASMVKPILYISYV